MIFSKIIDTYCFFETETNIKYSNSNIKRIQIKRKKILVMASRRNRFQIKISKPKIYQSKNIQWSKY